MNKKVIRYLLVLCLPFVLLACPIIEHREDSPWVFSDTISMENETSSYPFVLLLELSGRWNNYNVYSAYLEIKNIDDRVSSIDIIETFGREAWLDSLILFNLRDTTSITWDAVCLDWICSNYFETLFRNHRTPPWEMSSVDSLKWYVSERSWSDFYGSQGYYSYYVRVLRITDELLDIMEKNYSMLERFAEFYEQQNKNDN